MVKKKREEDYELVPESKFHELEAKVESISKSPFVSTTGVEKMGVQLEGTQDSILSLLEVLKQIANATNFDDAEKDIIKKQIKPLTKEIKEVKAQNETLATSMVEILNKLEILESKVISPTIHTVSHTALPPVQAVAAVSQEQLPPIEGGPVPPSGFEPELSSSPVEQFQPVTPLNASMPPPISAPADLGSGLPALPPIGGTPVEGIPPLTKPKKGFFK